MQIWTLAIIGLTVAFLISFYFTANTIIYALMRNRVDGTELDEIYETPEEGPTASAGLAVPSASATSE